MICFNFKGQFGIVSRAPDSTKTTTLHEKLPKWSSSIKIGFTKIVDLTARFTILVELLERCSTKFKLAELEKITHRCTGYIPPSRTGSFTFPFFPTHPNSYACLQGAPRGGVRQGCGPSGRRLARPSHAATSPLVGAGHVESYFAIDRFIGTVVLFAWERCPEQSSYKESISRRHCALLSLLFKSSKRIVSKQ